MNLVTVRYTQDGIKQHVREETARPVYCSVRSATGTEWFNAGRAGMQPSYIFTMFEPDYHGEKTVEFEGRRYGIYRTYRTGNELIELHAEEKGGLDAGN